MKTLQSHNKCNSHSLLNILITFFVVKILKLSEWSRKINKLSHVICVVLHGYNIYTSVHIKFIDMVSFD